MALYHITVADTDIWKSEILSTISYIYIFIPQASKILTISVDSNQTNF